MVPFILAICRMLTVYLSHELQLFRPSSTLAGWCTPTVPLEQVPIERCFPLAFLRMQDVKTLRMSRSGLEHLVRGREIILRSIIGLHIPQISFTASLVRFLSSSGYPHSINCGASSYVLDYPLDFKASDLFRNNDFTFAQPSPSY